jgi:hypothetical protein
MAVCLRRRRAMKRGLSLALVAVATVIAALAARALLVQAQPVASITLPPPSGTVELYAGCNNISLTFPDGTASDTVAQAVTPTGALQAMWRHNTAQNRFEGFSPAAPQASDLLTVDFLDAVWLCMAVPAPAVAPSPGAVSTPTAPTQLACTRSVTPSGSDDNPGTAEAPWQTIQHAADTAQPGDTVCVGSGDYSAEGELFFSNSGTAGASIAFTATPGETATVQALTLNPGTSYLTLVGFAVQGFPIWGVTLRGDNHHILLSHLTVSGGEAGFRLTEGNSGENPANGPVSDVILEDSVVRDSTYTAVDCTPGPCDQTTFRRLEIYGSGLQAGFGGDGLGLERGRDVLVEDCFIHDNGGDGIDLNSRDFAGNVTGIVVRRNRVARNHLEGIKLWAGGRMENNVVWGQGIAPVALGMHPGAYEVVNNTIAYNMYSTDYSERDYAFVAAYPNPDTGTSATIQLTLVNNVFAFNTSPQIGDGPTGLYFGDGVQLTEHHNLYWSREDGEIEAEFVTTRDPWFTRAEIAGGTWTSVTSQGQGDVTADPLFVSRWSEVDLHLQAGSPAVGAGSPNGAPSDDAEGHPRTGTPDIGAYER